MIIQKIDGGLGNQLFQYAFGYATSLKLKEPFRYETHALHHRNRKFMLDKFCISSQELVLPYAKYNNKLWKLIAAIERRVIIRVFMLSKWIIEKPQDYYKYNSTYQKKNGKNQYYVGFYQNYQYFDKYAAELKKEFRIKKEYLSEEVLNVVDKIKPLTTCSIHIRKGDYPEQWLVNPQYYIDAIELIENKYKISKFIVFCENREYAEAVLPNSENIVYATDLGTMSDLDEFFLMSQTTHHIISNSTFSWWAAYLGNHLDTSVVCPVTKMFISSFYLPTWIKLNNEK